MTVTRYEGSCGVCGENIVFIWDHTDGIVDIGIRINDQGEVTGSYTWVRHYATAPIGANPDCAHYFSEVDAVAVTKEIRVDSRKVLVTLGAEKDCYLCLTISVQAELREMNLISEPLNVRGEDLPDSITLCDTHFYIFESYTLANT